MPLVSRVLLRSRPDFDAGSVLWFRKTCRPTRLTGLAVIFPQPVPVRTEINGSRPFNADPKPRIIGGSADSSLIRPEVSDVLDIWRA
jgi:hypothetical protein